MPTLHHNIRRLAIAFAAGPMQDPAELIARVAPLIGDPRKARWLTPLAESLYREFADQPRPSWREVARRIACHKATFRAWRRGSLHILRTPVPAAMAPAPGAPRSWPVPAITTVPALADALHLHPDDLGWLTGPGQAEHYLHRWRQKPKSGRYRLLEIPKPLLKLAQRRLLAHILEAIPPHEAAHGFRRGRSVRDFVAPHCARPIVLRMDLRDWFPSLGATRVGRLFLTAGYPEEIAALLTRLCTHAVPSPELSPRPLDWPERKRLAAPHLPQGAPSSPALANLCAFRLDCRLAGLARSVGATYTRYADDLLFSGDSDLARHAGRFLTAAGAIVIAEGFLPNHRKTRLRRSAQRQEAAGLVLNELPNIPRPDFDRLKATLTNCLRHGPASQNRHQHPHFRAHLHGKVSWVTQIHPTRGAKLTALLDQIPWDENG